MTTFPTVDASRARLHQAGWSIGETAAGGWLVTGRNGENISATGATQAEAWHKAFLQAEAVGMGGKITNEDWPAPQRGRAGPGKGRPHLKSPAVGGRKEK